MLTVETIGRIRREHFVNGKTIRQIARDLRVSRNTVRKMLRSGETSLAYDRDVQPLPKLGRWTTDLDELLARNETKAAREQLTLIRIFEELRDSSQLIIITHQKRTMEIADALYGVTMRRDGVTEVISQRLRDAQTV